MQIKQDVLGKKERNILAEPGSLCGIFMDKFSEM
jgi:hypothetical protein